MSDVHFTRAELEVWRDAGVGDRSRIIEHLAACAPCRHLAAELERLRPSEALPARFDPDDFVSAGYHVRAGATWWRRSRLVPLAAAAAIVVMLVVPAWLWRRAADPVFRGSNDAIALVHPVGRSVPASDLTFEWRIAAGSSSVRLYVFDLATPDTPVIQKEVSVARYAPTSEERSRLRSGREYSWFVEYRGAGDAVETSPSARFVVR